MKQRYMYGVKIMGIENSFNLVLCGNCFEAFAGQIVKFEHIKLMQDYPMGGSCKHFCCAVCGQLFFTDLRSGVDRREYTYEAHIPERRQLHRRETGRIV